MNYKEVRKAKRNINFRIKWRLNKLYKEIIRCKKEDIENKGL